MEKPVVSLLLEGPAKDSLIRDGEIKEKKQSLAEFEHKLLFYAALYNYFL